MIIGHLKAGNMRIKKGTNMKIYETSSAPYYLNTNNTAKEYSDQYNTNPEICLLDSLSKNPIIERNYEVESPIIIQEFVIVNK